MIVDRLEAPNFHTSQTHASNAHTHIHTHLIYGGCVWCEVVDQKRAQFKSVFSRVITEQHTIVAADMNKPLAFTRTYIHTVKLTVFFGVAHQSLCIVCSKGTLVRT